MGAFRSIAAKRLYRPKEKQQFIEEIILKEHTVDLESFYHQCYVNEALLRRQIDTLLQERPVCSLGDLAEAFGIDKGVAELVGYLSIARLDEWAQIAEDETEQLDVRDFDGNKKRVVLPKITFVRREK
jgi:hypothetical protein